MCLLKTVGYEFVQSGVLEIKPTPGSDYLSLMLYFKDGVKSCDRIL